MSKTKNNAIDPLIVMNELGTDALRFTLLVGSAPGNDMNISIKKIEANRNFANKVWNIGRFVIGTLERAPKEAQGDPNWTLADSWIWARLRKLVNDVNYLFESHQYGEAGRQVYDFLWSEFADWYLEISKIQMDAGGDCAYYTAFTLVKVLDTVLRLLHPFTPFVTEAIWGYLKNTCEVKFKKFSPEGGWEDALIIASWPERSEFEGWEDEKIAEFSIIQDLIKSIRNIRAENKIEVNKKIAVTIRPGDKHDILKNQSTSICTLSGIDPDKFELNNIDSLKPDNAITLVMGTIEIYVSVDDSINKQAEAERVAKELREIESHIDRLNKLLSGPFVRKAPTGIVEKEREKLSNYLETAVKLREYLNQE